MKSKATILMIFLPVVAITFVTQKSSARQSPRIKDTTGAVPSVSVRERFLGTWELSSTEYRYSDGAWGPYPDVGPHGKGYLPLLREITPYHCKTRYRDYAGIM